MSSSSHKTNPILSEVLPEVGMLYAEKGEVREILCKPKIMAIKSITLQKIEQLEKDAYDALVKQREQAQGDFGRPK